MCICIATDQRIQCTRSLSRSTKRNALRVRLSSLIVVSGSYSLFSTCAAAAIMLMIQNNLDPRVAQFPHELVTYGGNGSVFSNWCVSRFSHLIVFRLFMHGYSDFALVLCLPFLVPPSLLSLFSLSFLPTFFFSLCVSYIFSQGAVPPCDEVPVGDDRGANPRSRVRPSGRPVPQHARSTASHPHQWPHGAELLDARHVRSAVCAGVHAVWADDRGLLLLYASVFLSLHLHPSLCLANCFFFAYLLEIIPFRSGRCVSSLVSWRICRHWSPGYRSRNHHHCSERRTQVSGLR